MPTFVIFAIIVAFILLVLFFIVLPWDQRRYFKKYFDMTVVPGNDAECRIAKPYMSARLQQYREKFDAACKAHQQHLLQPEAILPGAVDSRIEELRVLTQCMERASFELNVAQRIYDNTHSSPQEPQPKRGGFGTIEV
jgi:hypothetical protein